MQLAVRNFGIEIGCDGRKLSWRRLWRENFFSFARKKIRQRENLGKIRSGRCEKFVMVQNQSLMNMGIGGKFLSLLQRTFRAFHAGRALCSQQDVPCVPRKTFNVFHPRHCMCRTLLVFHARHSVCSAHDIPSVRARDITCVPSKIKIKCD